MSHGGGARDHAGRPCRVEELHGCLGVGRALAIDPGYPYGHRMLAIQLSHMQQHDEARAEIRRARELDPLYAMHHVLSAQIAFSARDPEGAAQFARQAVAIDPSFWIGHWQLAQALEQMADADGALSALDHAA